MKNCLLIVLLIVSAPVASQDLAEKKSLGNNFPSGFSNFISSLKTLNKNSEVALLKALSNHAHRTYLKRYTAYAHVNDIFTKGNYDCLSGTYFFCASLEQLGFRYRIIETNYHIFLMVQTSGGEVLLESTDRENGVVSDPKFIEEKLLSYRKSSSTETATNLYLSGIDLFGQLSPEQLPGLIYFNMAVEAFNTKRLVDCCTYLEQSWKIYNNPRIGHFVPILLKSVAGSNMQEKEKKHLTALLKAYPRIEVQTVAAR
jgi:hypothetical protein